MPQAGGIPELQRGDADREGQEMSVHWVGLFSGALLIVMTLAVGELVRLRQIKREIRELTAYTEQVQDKTQLPSMETMQEGDVRVLQSEVYKLAASLHEQYAREKARSGYLAEMLENISHQMKTPLSVITLMSENLMEDELDKETRDNCVRSIYESADHLTWLVHTLLAIAQMDAGAIAFRQETVSLAVLLASVLQDLSVYADLNGTALKMNVPGNVSIITDFRWTKEALSNIIRNAIEHTPGGTVRIRASQSVVAVDLDICDNGCGISEGDLPHIFERFYKGKQASPDSAGIGLSLAKEVIQKQNGSIEVSGAEGEGTAFHIRFFRTGTL